MQHQLDVVAHLALARLMRELAVGIAHQPVRGHVGA